MRAAALALVALTGVAVAGGAAAAAESLPFTSMTPDDGVVFAPTAGPAGFQWRITGGPTAAPFIAVRVSPSPNVGIDGQTLSAENATDEFLLGPSRTDASTFQGTSSAGADLWTNQPGTYYWQASAIWRDASPPSAQHVALGPIRRIVIQAPAPPPQPPEPAPPVATAAPGLPASPQSRPPRRSRLSMTARQASSYLRSLVRTYARRRPHGLVYRCSRSSAESFRCRTSWRDSRYAYRGTAEFLHALVSGEVSTLARFDGRRARRSCLEHRRFSRCGVVVHWSTG